MVVSLTKSVSPEQQEEINFYTILDYKVIVDKPTLFLVRESMTTVGIEQKEDGEFFEIFKVQFIAQCTTELTESLLIAFYIGEGGDLCPYILNGLPKGFYRNCERHRLIDYTSYTEICRLTGEKKLSFYDYFNEIKSGTLMTNTFLEYNGRIYNYDEQKKIWPLQ